MLKDTSRVHNTSFNVNDFEQDPKEYIRKAMEKYAGQTFVIQPGPEGGDTREVYIPTEQEMKQKTIVVE